MTSSDEDMTSIDMSMNVKDKVSSFLCLYNGKTKNLLQSNIGISIVLRKDDNDDRVWICHEQEQSWSTSTSKLNFRFFIGSIVLIGKARLLGKVNQLVKRLTWC